MNSIKMFPTIRSFALINYAYFMEQSKIAYFESDKKHIMKLPNANYDL